MQEVEKGHVLLRVLYTCGIVPRINYEEFWEEFVLKFLKPLGIDFDDLPSNLYHNIKHAFSFFKRDMSQI
jgi:hypothetical protein